MLFAGSSSCSGQSGSQVGQSARDFELKNLNGQSVSLKGQRGKPVLVNFWATWCGPCRGEMPYLEQIYQEWLDDGLVLLAIDIGESPSQVSAFLKSNGLDLPVLLDTRETVAEQYHITAVPTTFFIDKDGIIQDKVVGAFPDKKSIELYLHRIVP